MLKGDRKSAAIMVKAVQGIARQRSTTTSREEVVRHAWSDWRLGENHDKWRTLSRGFESAAGDGRKPVMPEDARPALDNS